MSFTIRSLVILTIESLQLLLDLFGSHYFFFYLTVVIKANDILFVTWTKYNRCRCLPWNVEVAQARDLGSDYPTTTLNLDHQEDSISDPQPVLSCNLYQLVMVGVQLSLGTCPPQVLSLECDYKTRQWCALGPCGTPPSGRVDCLECLSDRIKKYI